MTTQGFLAWEDRQEGKFEFNGRQVIPMTGGSLAHHDIVFSLRGLPGRLPAERPFHVAHQMRLRIGSRVRYADVVVCAGLLDKPTRTVTDAIAIFEVAHTAGDLVLPGINLSLALIELYHGLTFSG